MIPSNRLYFGDNLDFLRNPEYFPAESVDLIYLDLPFNSALVLPPDSELLKYLK